MGTVRSEVLLTTGEVFPHNFIGGNYFNVEAIDDLLKNKRTNNSTPNGVKEAVRLMLSQCATAIVFVDTEKTVETPFPDEDDPAYKRGIQLGFNDHMGGSESAFKILVNRYVDGSKPSQYVLYSPPREDGSSSNMIFRRANFTFLSHTADGLDYDRDTPNPLKTVGAAGYRGGDRDYQYFVFGNANTPLRFSQVFEDIGFQYNDSPYSMDVSSHLWRVENEARDRLDFTEMHQWPGQQFAGQLAVLETLEL